MVAIKHAFVSTGSPRKVNPQDWDQEHVIELPEGKTLVGGPGGVAIEVDLPEPGTPTAYEHVQSIPETIWTVNHNLGRRPSGVQVLSPGFQVVDVAIIHINENQLKVYFEQPQTGYVRAI